MPPTAPVDAVLARYYQELLNYFARTARGRDNAADLVHEAYARVLTLQRSGQAIAQPRALLYRTVRNLLVDQHRRSSVREPVPGGASEEAPLPDVAELAAPAALGPEALAASSQGMAALLATIDALPLRCRQAFILHKFDGLSHAEVAAQMGISRKMVEQHIQRAMQACRQCRQALEGEAAP
ncbi:RNA polymerase sigma-70 factor (ECF subfamily) [Acidovorax soli]|uniref:RNA polymerase sigma-70 factor (ECF subfamily) n=1 Tax=Acidovorax soli TaxID=592050 RepID=A0A7X0U7Q7_9BURK|nr:sigma-70 family RNA polymerase sigma factor [Acidovorax soli]MBB6557730.1 RNA polymerase sigma-70 factor (ECF subfamily) [Acidovorax soli]